MSEAYQERECRITDAVNAYCEGFYSNAAQAATAFQVEARTVRRRCAGVGSRSIRVPANRRLNPATEQAIVEWIERLDRMGASLRPGMLTSTANYFLNLGLPTRKL